MPVTRPFFFILICMVVAGRLWAQPKKELVDYVDNFIGVRDQNTSTVLGPQLPNASINPSPHGREWTQPWFNHSQIANGGAIEFVMGEKPVAVFR